MLSVWSVVLNIASQGVELAGSSQPSWGRTTQPLPQLFRVARRRVPACVELPRFGCVRRRPAAPWRAAAGPRARGPAGGGPEAAARGRHPRRPLHQPRAGAQGQGGAHEGRRAAPGLAGASRHPNLNSKPYHRGCRAAPGPAGVRGTLRALAWLLGLGTDVVSLGGSVDTCVLEWVVGPVSAHRKHLFSVWGLVLLTLRTFSAQA